MVVLATKRNLDPEKINRVAEILKTIGHPVRLEILEVLEAEEPLAVSEIQDRIGIPTEQSLLSHHLIKLKDKGLLRSEKRGMNVYYSLEDRKLLYIFDCMEQCTL
jgi:ArsR family transcriptional regulator